MEIEVHDQGNNEHELSDAEDDSNSTGSNLVLNVAQGGDGTAKSTRVEKEEDLRGSSQRYLARKPSA